jgi:hypothetical protein
MLAGCGQTEDQSSTSAELSKKDIYACQKDSDCVAISKGGCCPNGWNVAVNDKYVKKYEQQHQCKKPQICPLYVIDDTRQPECLLDATTGKRECTMVAIDQIQCGGFVANPHQCPDGYECKPNTIPDVPGTCVQCVDNVDCVAGSHWDSKACTCVPNCLDVVLCINGYHWSSTACQCVPNCGAGETTCGDNCCSASQICCGGPGQVPISTPTCFDNSVAGCPI